MNKNKKILTSSDISRKIVRIGHEIVENYSDISRIVLLGIHNRGVPIAKRLKFFIKITKLINLCINLNLKFQMK